MQRAELDAYLDQYLEVSKFRDYCPNGLQVEGTEDVECIVSGVTASACDEYLQRSRGVCSICGWTKARASIAIFDDSITPRRSHSPS